MRKQYQLDGWAECDTKACAVQGGLDGTVSFLPYPDLLSKETDWALILHCTQKDINAVIGSEKSLVLTTKHWGFVQFHFLLIIKCNKHVVPLKRVMNQMLQTNDCSWKLLWLISGTYSKTIIVILHDTHYLIDSNMMHTSVQIFYTYRCTAKKHADAVFTRSQKFTLIARSKAQKR